MVAGAASCVVFARWRVGGRFGAGMVSVRQKDRWCPLFTIFAPISFKPPLYTFCFHISNSLEPVRRRRRCGDDGASMTAASMAWRVRTRRVDGVEGARVDASRYGAHALAANAVAQFNAGQRSPHRRRGGGDAGAPRAATVSHNHESRASRRWIASILTVAAVLKGRCINASGARPRNALTRTLGRRGQWNDVSRDRCPMVH